MNKSVFVCIFGLISFLISKTDASAQRTVTPLKEGWNFTKVADGVAPSWHPVRIPHDWAIYGPFDRNNDIQRVAVEQNGEKEVTEKTGRTGGLPFIGRGAYRRTLEVPDTSGREIYLVFDGAMSNARVKVNGSDVAYWPYGYNSFIAPLTGKVNTGDNELVVELENFERASRWYPGAGLYRNVNFVVTDKVHIPEWGTYATTPTVSDSVATVKLDIEIQGAAIGDNIGVFTQIYAPDGMLVAENKSDYRVNSSGMFSQNFVVDNPALWSVEVPSLYTARTSLYRDECEIDRYDTRFGIRKLDYIPERGLYLNGNAVKFRGVCNHHDLGPLGAAVNRSALQYQIEMMKDMGVNAIRTAHNMPAPELVELCDEMGMMLMVEPFDDWGYKPKSPNGYGAFFAEWAEKDLTNMVKRFRNNPSVVMWSIGNEVPSQWPPSGIEELNMLKSIVKFLDPTRPVTCGMDQIHAVLKNGFAAALDIPGFNYKPQYYEKAYDILPQKMILGSETASTVSSRGRYHFPVSFEDEHYMVMHPDHQSSSYDNEACSWSNTPDIDFYMDEQPWVLGQFVWTGFDYLGEPSPYDTDSWPSHSSVFGIIDLASLPKDRYYLYRSQWNKADETLHVLPHWTWPGREGEITPVFVYTSYPSAELFVNGESMGKREKNDSTLQTRYRLMWNDVKYAPGEIKVVAFDEDGKEVAEKTVRTAGKPHHLVATTGRTCLTANGEDLAYITVSVADKDGNLVPDDHRRVKFMVNGAGSFEATANGDPTCLLPFQKPEMDLFSGAATAIVRSSTQPGELKFTVTAKGLRPASVTIPVKE